MNKYQKALSGMAKFEMKGSYCKGSYKVAKKTITKYLSKEKVIEAHEYGVTLADILGVYDCD